MTRNPYAQPETPFSFAETQRTSALAITSLVLSILGLLSCPFLVLGVIGFLCGVVALYFISSSSGRLVGRGMALSGVVVGLLSIAVGVAIWIGISQFVRAGFGVPAQDVMRAIEAQDRAGLRAVLEPGVDQSLTDAEVDAFLSSASAAAGTFQKIEPGLISFISAMAEHAVQTGSGGRVENEYAMWARTSNGRVLLVMKVEPTAHAATGSMSVAGAITDLGVVVNGTEVWLQTAAPPAPGTP